MTEETYAAQAMKFCGLVSQHLPVLPVETIQKWVKNPQALQRALEKTLSSPPDAPKAVLPSIAVTIGTGAGANALKSALSQGQFCVTDWAKKLLAELTFVPSAEKSEVALVIRSLRELGFEDGALYMDICAKAKEMGLALCSVEMVLQLRLQYLNQPRDEWFIVATEPISNSRGRPNLFYVGHGNDGLTLSADYGSPKTLFSHLHRFAFVLPSAPH